MTATDFVVSADWLAQHLNDANVLVIDCRFALADPDLGHRQYLEGHIPGAHYLDLNRDLSSPVQTHGGRHPLPNPETLAAKLAAIGVTFQQTFVVAYDASRLAFASRVWWLLRYLGHDRVAVLDGGWQGWQTAGLPVESTVPTPTPGNFVPQVRSLQAVDIATVKASQERPGVVLIDAREGDRYRGEREPIDPVAGHIPGAVNYPWQDATDERGFLKPVAAHQQRWQQVSGAKEAIVYCGSGVTACVNLLSMELAGIPGKLYAGSWSDWCSYL